MVEWGWEGGILGSLSKCWGDLQKRVAVWNGCRIDASEGGEGGESPCTGCFLGLVGSVLGLLLDRRSTQGGTDLCKRVWWGSDIGHRGGGDQVIRQCCVLSEFEGVSFSIASRTRVHHTTIRV